MTAIQPSYDRAAELRWPSGESTFSARLDALVSSLHPPDRGPWTNEEVAEGIQSAGGPALSVAYVQQLRKGRRDNPSFALVAALARFFRVPVSYFADDNGAEPCLSDEDVALLSVVRRPELKDVVIKLDTLGPETQQVVVRLIDELMSLGPGIRQKQ